MELGGGGARRTSQPLTGAAYSMDSSRASGISLATQEEGQQTERSRLSRACVREQADHAKG